MIESTDLMIKTNLFNFFIKESKFHFFMYFFGVPKGVQTNQLYMTIKHKKNLLQKQCFKFQAYSVASMEKTRKKNLI